jgi:hypothetical protein
MKTAAAGMSKEDLKLPSVVVWRLGKERLAVWG